MRNFLQHLHGLASSRPVNAPPSSTGLERRTLAAIAFGAFSVTVSIFLMSDLRTVWAESDDSAASFWLAERARKVSRAIYQSPNVVQIVASVQKKTRAPKSQQASQALSGGQSVCVRLCDGFFFPVGGMHGRSDVSSHESVGQSQCPGAPTALYVMPGSSTRIEDAVSSRDGRKYAALPVALRYTQTRDKTCSCKPAGVMSLATAPLANDFTLRRGDSIMTDTGVKVFRGSRSRSPRSSDFLALSRSRDIEPRQRATLNAIERVSVLRRPQPAQQAASTSPRPAPAPVSLTQKIIPVAPERTVRLIDPRAAILR